ncbi:1-deoxy-D-xylulose 5-phosphate reductoisomerase [Breznakia blatticola]|uniref:1-deoxy-D-xylulose 5-phosphate reductoisomerase n=1 Tax=Breznakia blatticola TaxID=1754012 RepID=A0A4R7ZTS3_9FIRM|nr:1-deoxy-D-xylulose-5-phosphate reductoisomerase [Breznakia blatticola]TDW20331.1 1-deoxy-D-xylulose 5-phosphate reductoisomerase [Breznakia blatticola]
MKKIILLGASGSIGMQTIDVVLGHPEEYEIVAMSIGRNMDALEKIIQLYPKCRNYSVLQQEDAKVMQEIYPELSFTCEDEGLLSLLDIQADVVVNALVGFAGLKPSLKTIEKGMVLALANKESLVTGGPLVKAALKKYNGTMLPIDSEHSAIFQCLQGNKHSEIKRLIVSASGGSFRDKTREELVNVTVKDALNHPNWSMGKRITIDSATMMNKGFEVIEAYYLFDVDFDHIDVIINKESIVHSLVEYVDHSVIAQLGTADMRIPIQYALSYPDRLSLKQSEPLDLVKVGMLHFQAMDFHRFPLLELAYKAGRRGGNSGAILNAADEVAVQLFLEEKISFLQIEECITKAYEQIQFIENPTYEDLLATDLQTRAFVSELGGN